MTQFKNFVRAILRALAQTNFTNLTLLALAKANFLPQWIWRRLPVEKTFLVLLPNRQSFRYSAIANDGIGRVLFWRGLNAWEPETISIFYNLAQRSNLVLDIGANTGIFTLLACAANNNAKVISFEPVPSIYERLVSHAKMNEWEDRCQVRNEAVSNIIGAAKFHVPFGDVPKSASLEPQGFRGNKGILIDVPVTTIDAIISENEQVDLIKIDVEGFEDKVLEGMQRVLANSAPNIIVECNPDGPFLAVETILTRFGYRFFHMCGEKLVAVDKIIPDEKEIYILLWSL